MLPRLQGSHNNSAAQRALSYRYSRRGEEEFNAEFAENTEKKKRAKEEKRK
jgi:hypothetical protein